MTPAVPRYESAQDGDPRFFVVVVLYRMSLFDSATVRSLLASSLPARDSTVLLWDNGEHPQDTDDVDRLASAGDWTIDYVHTPDNVGLPKIYTAAIERSEAHDVVVLFDQDSSFDDVYVSAVAECAADHPSCALFLPIVESHDRIVSPGWYRWVKGRYWTSRRTGLISSRCLTAINSGMAIRRSYLVNEFAGYNPRLRFYGVDTYFMLEYAKRRPDVYVLDVTVQHQSALLEPDATAASRLARYAQLFDAWLMLHEAHPVRSWLARAYVLWFGLRESLRARDPRFIRLATKSVGALRSKRGKCA